MALARQVERGDEAHRARPDDHHRMVRRHGTLLVGRSPVLERDLADIAHAVSIATPLQAVKRARHLRPPS